MGAVAGEGGKILETSEGERPSGQWGEISGVLSVNTPSGQTGGVKHLLCPQDKIRVHSLRCQLKYTPRACDRPALFRHTTGCQRPMHVVRLLEKKFPFSCAFQQKVGSLACFLEESRLFHAVTTGAKPF